VRPPSAGHARHTFLAHTAELAVQLTAETPGDLFAEACRALGLLVLAETGTAVPAEADVERTLVIEAVDVEALLVDLLNELIYLAETERWAPRSAHTLSWQPDRLVVKVLGTRLQAAPSRIKSATHHGLAVREGLQGWEAEVILDV
jgi:SHS2 domain-containing protein